MICQNLNHTARGSNWVPGGLKFRSPRHCFWVPDTDQESGTKFDKFSVRFCHETR
jgi:hypothetical protein